MFHGRAVMGGVLVLLIGLGLVRSEAQPLSQIQLCGFDERFADTVLINGLISNGTDLYVTAGWKQQVPHLYTLLGVGGIIRGNLDQVPIDLSLYQGGIPVVNPSDSQFLGNPNCAITLLLRDVSLPQLVLFNGVARVLCTGNPNTTPFEINLNLVLSTCQQPGFPADVASMMHPALADAPNRATFGPAGSAPNEYGTR